jgi:hypothetical protein
LINLISADSTHHASPSAMSEVHDNTAVHFEGMQLRVLESIAKGEQQDTGDLKGAVTQFFSGIVDDIFGPKKSP